MCPPGRETRRNIGKGLPALEDRGATETIEFRCLRQPASGFSALLLSVPPLLRKSRYLYCAACAEHRRAGSLLVSPMPPVLQAGCAQRTVPISTMD